MKMIKIPQFSNNMCAVIICLLLFSSQMLFAQHINTDSLLVQAYNSLKQKDYTLALKRAHLGKKVSPEYLDFQVLIGRIHQLRNQPDSTRIYLNRVLDKNPAYEEAFLYLINLELETKNDKEAEKLINKAIEVHSDNKTFQLKKLQLYQLQEDVDGERKHLSELSALYPEDSEIQQRLFWLDSRFNSDRIGLQYSLTNFDRDVVGPWHLGALQYIGERKWGSVIGRVNYAHRRSNGTLLLDGIQFEGESYFYTGENSYANVSVGYSDDLVFPKWRLGASYFQTLPKGWEVDLGMRYTHVAEQDIPAGTLGVGKYFGSYWTHLRSYFQEQNENIYPAFTLTSRYYYNTRFDYVNVILGYGTSPDERVIQADLNQRVQLNSFRAGLGYYRQFGRHFITGVQAVYNRQEYMEDNWQNEFETFVMLQYRL
ncbi:YaiO family outer membrane beta-barrel protein [Mariniflexile sp. HMF6888]|uniref:YaiO family outer membrane beta-barrel protein n=1 Tax=Mariniflexile sp. HMF6888 TaxID=3373086 RepID=UPI00378F86A4